MRVGITVFVAAASAAIWPAEARPGAAERIFARRILPIFQSPNPSSCTECHLAGVDLKDYILPSHEKTFLSLRDQGLVDVAHPEQSKILRFIAMTDDGAQAASPITGKARRREQAAFAAWIAACARDPRLRALPALPKEELARPARVDEVIRHGRSDRVLASFIADVWSQRFRCANCHAPGSRQNAKIVAEHGDDVTWIRPEGPAATIRYLVENGSIDVDQPEQSRLLRKATGEIKHGGGVKMRKGDAAYLGFRRWLEDYARARKGRYAQLSDLPSGPAWFGSEVWLRVKGAPAAWKGKLVTMTVHAPAAEPGRFEDSPIAVTSTVAEANADNAAWGTFAHMTLSFPVRGGEILRLARSPDPPSLAAGRYQVRVRLGADDEPGEHVGRAEVSATWRSGYKEATELTAAQLLR